MIQEFSNKLSKAELERLALLAEECGEVIQIVNKIIRHGYKSYNPYDEDKTENRELLNKEVSHLTLALDLMSKEGDINEDRVDWHFKAKQASIYKYLHHNKV